MMLTSAFQALRYVVNCGWAIEMFLTTHQAVKNVKERGRVGGEVGVCGSIVKQ